jgi:GntR family transcriptional regulator, histidine utilization repressor
MSEARYRQIRQELEAKISSGEWPPGHPVPAETELARAYGCARMTANKALSALAEAGLIVRRRRAGSVVAVPPARPPRLELAEVGTEVGKLGLAYSHRLRAREVRPANDRDASLLGVARGRPLLALSCLHQAAGRPFAHEERLIGLEAVPAAEAADFSAIAPGAWLLTQLLPGEPEHRIRAASAPGSLARALGLEPGGAVLVVETALPAVTWSVLSYPGSGHTLVAR